MGIAAYNRGNKVIRQQIDDEIVSRRIVIRRVASRHECEMCFAKLGVRLERGCVWSNRAFKWIDACDVCKNIIQRENQRLSR